MSSHLTRRRFLTLTAGVGTAILSGCLFDSGDDGVALIAHNESSHTQTLRVRLFKPSGDYVDTYSYALEPDTSVEGMHTVSGAIGEVAASAHAQNTLEELPDARTRYEPDIECDRGRPAIVITLRDERISFSYAC